MAVVVVVLLVVVVVCAWWWYDERMEENLKGAHTGCYATRARWNPGPVGRCPTCPWFQASPCPVVVAHNGMVWFRRLHLHAVVADMQHAWRNRWPASLPRPIGCGGF